MHLFKLLYTDLHALPKTFCEIAGKIKASIPFVQLYCTQMQHLYALPFKDFCPHKISALFCRAAVMSKTFIFNCQSRFL